jgi:aminopeptidase N
MNGQSLSRWLVPLLAGASSMPAAAQTAQTSHTAQTARAREPSRTVDVLHVDLDLRVDWPVSALTGTATISAVPLRATRTLPLDAWRLQLSGVTTASGVPLAFALDSVDRDDALRIQLDREYGVRDTIRVRIAYRTGWINHADPNALGGSTGRGVRFFVPTTTEPIKRRQLWTMGEPHGNRAWFPSYDRPDDLRTSRVRVTVDEPLMAVSNGTMALEHRNSDGTRTFEWRLDVPHANHRTALAVGQWTDIVSLSGSVPLHSLSYPDEVKATTASVERLPEMMAYFARMTGARYPYPSYSQLFVQDVPWGVGTAALPILTENMVDDERTHAEYRWLWDGLQAEAVASQWFGGLVAPADWRDAWLSRGLAHYFDGLFNEHRNSRAEFLLWHMGGDQLTYLADWNSGVRHPIVPSLAADGVAFAGDNYPSARAGLVLHMLRHVMGDSAWWQGIRSYVAQHAGRTVRTADFQGSMERAHGASLGWFFDQWVHRMGHPVFQVTTQHDATAKTLTVVVRQLQQRDTTSKFPQVEFFQGPVTIAIDDRIETVRLARRAENRFTFRVAGPPKLVNFDREGTWIKELRFSKSTDALAHQARFDTDPVGQLWAIRALGATLRADSVSAADRSRALVTLRELSADTLFWRLRLTALTALTGWVTSVPPAERATRIDAPLRAALLGIIRRDTSWVRAQAITMLGEARDSQYDPILRPLLRDRFHTVNYTAAIALGRAGGAGVFDTLVALMHEPSWKGENVLAGLVGLDELKDARAAPIALAAFADTTSSRWFLATPRWDTRIAAANVLVTLGAAEQAWPILERRFAGAMAEGDVNDIFSNVLLMATLGSARAGSAFEQVRARFANDPNALAALDGHQKQWEQTRAMAAKRPHLGAAP